jgi:hypothetical protein
VETEKVSAVAGLSALAVDPETAETKSIAEVSRLSALADGYAIAENLASHWEFPGCLP